MPSSGDALRGLADHERERIPERYEILGELGRGGMAVVYRARDRQLDREVALKVLRDDLPIELEDRQRFRREAEAAAKLQHPNIVTILDAGETFLVMELVRGQPFDPRDRDFDALEKVARAIHQAHERGIVHRDLKPSNILMGDEPKVADFGIARLLGNRTKLTQSGAIIGTPQYMAPEQVRGEEATPRTDVYALGAILYEMLAGRTPFAADTPVALFWKIANEEPAAVAGDPGVIALKALEKEPGRRYASARDFAEDLARWRRGEPILAKPASAWYRLRKKIAKRKAAVIAGAAGGVALAVALAILVPNLIRARRTLELWSRVSVLLNEADRYAAAGEAATSREKLDEGIRICREFLGDHDVAEARYFLGRLLRARGRRAEAIAELTRALERNPDLGEARFERGLARVEDYGEAYERIEAGTAGRTPTRDAMEEFEKAHPGLREIRDLAIGDLQVSVGESPYFRPVDGEYGRAELARMLWKFDDARAGLRRVLELDRLYVSAHLSLAKIAMYFGDWDGMIRETDEAIVKHRGLGVAHRLRARALFWRAEGLGLSKETIEIRRRALEDADRAIALGENAWAERGNVLLRTGPADEAIAAFEKSLAIEPRDAIARNHLGILRNGKGDHRGAIEEFTRAIEVAPMFAMAYRNRAQARALNGEMAAAIADAEKAAEIVPEKSPHRPEILAFRDFLRKSGPK